MPREVVQLLFLPDEVVKLHAVLEALGKGEGVRYAARMADFESFFEALLKCKEAEGIVNSATAVLRMVEIVEGYLAEKANFQGASGPEH